MSFIYSDDRRINQAAKDGEYLVSAATFYYNELMRLDVWPHLRSDSNK